MDIERLVDAVAKAVMQRLSGDLPRVAAFGCIPEGFLPESAEIKAANSVADAGGCDYVVMTAEAFYKLCGNTNGQASPAPSSRADAQGKAIDLTGKRLIHERDLRDKNTAGGDVITVSKNAIITALAYDYAKGIGAKIKKE